MTTAATIYDQTDDEVYRFVGALYEPDDIVEIRFIPHDRPGAPRKKPEAWLTATELKKTEIATRLQEVNREGHHIYIGINPRKTGGTPGVKAEDCTPDRPCGKCAKCVAIARCLFVDFDNDTTPFEATVRIGEAGLPVPTMVVHSGHGVHCYWRLESPIHDLDEWRARQEGLIDALDSDKQIKDAPRIMRLPGFLNVKKSDLVACAVVECDPARQYPLDEFPGAAPRPTRTARPSGKVNKDERENAISYLAKLKSERADKYADWLSIGMALHSVDDSEAMLTEWDRWSRSSSKWQDGICAEKWGTFTANGSLRIATLHAWANEDSPTKLAIPHKAPPAARPSTLTTQELAALPLTDTGNAERLVARHGNDLRFSRALGWLCWDGRRWKRDDTGEAERRAKRTVRELYNEAASLNDPDERKNLAVWAKSSESAARRRNLLDLAKSETVVVITPDELDRDDFLFNVKNGTINLRTGELQPHNRADLITKLAPVDNDPNATCPTFDRFLDETVCGRKDLSRYLQQTFGMYLTGDISEQILFIGIGTGSNGKNTLIDQMTDIWGDYASEAAPGLLVAQKHQQHPTEIADLLGKRLIIATETERNEHLRVQFVKRLTGDAKLKGRFMHRDFFEFRRTCKVVLITNNRPVISERTHAIWRRLRLVPFDNVVADQDQDKALPEKLRAESSGILAWLVRGCLSWQQDGIATPEAVRLATDEYRAESDWLGRFAEECLTFAPELWSTSARLAETLDDWCREVGVEADMPALREHMRREGCSPKARRGRGRGWEGVGVVDSSEVREE